MWIYPNLRTIRKQNKLSQTQVAKILGTTQNQYSKYETGIQELPAHHFVTLAKFYNTTADYLLGLSDEKKPNT